MKKICGFLILIMLSSIVLAAGPQGASGNGMGNSETNDAGQGNVQEASVTSDEQTVTKPVQAKNANELKQMVQTRSQEMAGELNKMGNEDKQKVFQNQNQVRLAVHALLSMEDLVGGIGKNVSAIAREFNNSVQKTIQSEERIQTRSRFVRFFAGGDAEAADEIESEVQQNQNRIQQLEQLRLKCSCSAEIKTMLQEQIQNLQQEQTRLNELAGKEKQSKGLFGWMWK